MNYPRTVAMIVLVVITQGIRGSERSARAQLAADRYLAYKAKLSTELGGTKLPKTVTVLQDQFRSDNCTVKKEVALCNAATQNGEAPTQPTVHEVGYRIKCATKFRKQSRLMFDQFFPAGITVELQEPHSLLAPSGESDDATVVPAVPAPDTVDHFLCYKAKGPALALSDPALSEQFFTTPITATLKKISKLCTPVSTGNGSPGAQNHLGHLLCYKVKLAEGVKFAKRDVRTNNSALGTNPLTVVALTELCVPAYEDAACGAAGQGCCTGALCNAGLACLNNVCAYCGATGQACCPGDTCVAGLACSCGRCASGSQIGGAGEACCPDATCNAGLVCLNGVCTSCGGAGLACCAGDTCSAGMACSCGICTGASHAGGAGQVCCPDGTCGTGLVCQNDVCTFCGAVGQGCCANGTCSSGSVCLDNLCAFCGGAGQPCCTGDACDSALTCGGGTCLPGSLNETGVSAEADWCAIPSPASVSVQAGQQTSAIYGDIFEANLTEIPGAPAGIVAQVGFGPSGTDPRYDPSWVFFTAAYNEQIGSNDEFVGILTAPASAGTYSYVYRFSADAGVSFTYCDLDGAGSDPGYTFEPAALGQMTVAP